MGRDRISGPSHHFMIDFSLLDRSRDFRAVTHGLDLGLTNEETHVEEAEHGNLALPLGVEHTVDHRYLWIAVVLPERKLETEYSRPTPPHLVQLR